MNSVACQYSLPDLVRNNGRSAFQTVVPRLLRQLLTLEPDAQVLPCSVLIDFESTQPDIENLDS